MCHDPSVHQEELKPNSTDLSNFREEDREELMAIRFPTNVNKTDDLANRVFCQKSERYKNKQKVLFGGSNKTQPPQQQSSNLKLKYSLPHVSFMIIAYTCYRHQAVALMKRLSRSAFIMTHDKEVLALFTKKRYEIPLFSNHSLFYTDDSVTKAIKLMDRKEV